MWTAVARAANALESFPARAWAIPAFSYTLARATTAGRLSAACNATRGSMAIARS
jgi:hypothetical protein